MNTQMLEFFGQHTQKQYVNLTSKALFESEFMEPYMGPILFPYYNHYCLISFFDINISDKHFGIFDSGCHADNRYDRIAMLLKRI
ncbi:hypothetical protein QUA83_06885 [Microcoleus sp. K1-B1]|uniref:hypothetical protein n=1 Tax=unclassified Microcoleus TaxID=2642155 RepID=UPI002FCF4C11